MPYKWHFSSKSSSKVSRLWKIAAVNSKSALQSVNLRKHDQTKLNLRGIVKIIIFIFKKHFWVRHLGPEMTYMGFLKEFLKEALIKAIFQAKFDQNA